jgi:type IV pilus assembly protein PilA
MTKLLKSKRGFTLVELIVVLAILALISSIAVPRFLGIQEQAKIDADYATGAMIAKASELYLAQNEDATTVDKTALQLSDVNFESSKIAGKTLTDVTVTPTVSTGAIVVTVAITEGSVQIYPNEGGLDS